MNLALANAPAYSLGPLIHNSVAVEALEAQGVRVAQTVSDIPAGARAIIRSHGVSREVLNALEARAETIDATCPYVASIHRMVAEAAEAGIPVLVCGQREHPEVVGTMGWAGENARVVSSEDEARALPRMERALVVAQTTLGAARYRAIARAIEARVDAPDVRMTVCAATEKRQEEAARLAGECDVMIVVGDPASANSCALYEIAKAHCARTHFIREAGELGSLPMMIEDRIGITAGASTPDCTFKEVVARMNDIENKVNTVEAPPGGRRNASRVGFRIRIREDDGADPSRANDHRQGGSDY